MLSQVKSFIHKAESLGNYVFTYATAALLMFIIQERVSTPIIGTDVLLSTKFTAMTMHLTFAEYDIKANWKAYKRAFLGGAEDEDTER